MKTPFLSCLLGLFLFFHFDTNAQVSSFFEKYQDKNSIEYIEFTKESLSQEFNINIEDQKELNKLASSLDLVQFINAHDNIDAMYKEALNSMSGIDYQSLIDIRSNGEHIKAYVLEDDDIIKEWLIIIKSTQEFVLGRISGEFKMSDFNDVLSTIKDFESGQKKDFMSSSKRINATPTNQMMITDLQIYPNPIEKNQPVTVSFEAKENIKGSYIIITDLSGKQIYKQQLSELKPGPQKVSISDFNQNLSGSFIVSLIRNDKVLSEAIIVN